MLALMVIAAAALLAAGCARGSVSEIIPNESANAADEAVEPGDESVDNACYESYEAVQEGAARVACTDEHLAEIVAVYETEGDDYPGEILLTQTAQDRCPAEFRDQTGVAIDTTIAALGIIYPTADAWDDGNRSTVCVIAFPTSVNQPLSGLDPQRAYGLTTFYGLEAGDCLDDISNADFLQLAPCALPHSVEVFEILEMDPGPFPGEAKIENLAINHCFERYDATYQNSASITDTPFDYVAPTERTWTSLDDRAVVCLAYVDAGT